MLSCKTNKIIFRAVCVVLICGLLLSGVGVSSYAVTDTASDFALAPPLATKPPCEIHYNANTGTCDVVTNNDVIEAWDRETVRNVRQGETLGKSFRNRWAYVDVGYLIGQMLILAREHKLQNPKDILIPLIKKHIRNRDEEAEILLEGFNIDGIEEVREGQAITGFSLPVTRNSTPAYRLVYNLRGGDTTIQMKDAETVYIRAEKIISGLALRKDGIDKTVEEYGIEFSYSGSNIISINKIVGKDKAEIKMALVALAKQITTRETLETIVETLRNEKSLFSDDEKINIISEVFASSSAYIGDKPPYFVKDNASIFAKRMKNYTMKNHSPPKVKLLCYGISDGSRIYQIIEFARVIGVDVELVGIDYSQDYLKQSRGIFPTAKLLNIDLLNFDESNKAFQELVGQIDFIDSSFLIHEIYSFGGRHNPDESIDDIKGKREVKKLLASSYKLLKEGGEMVITDPHILSDGEEPVTVEFSERFARAYNEFAKQYEPVKIPTLSQQQRRITISKQILTIALDKMTFFLGVRRRPITNERISREMREKSFAYSEADFLNDFNAVGFKVAYLRTFNYEFFKDLQRDNVKIDDGQELPKPYLMFAVVKSKNPDEQLVEDRNVTITSVSVPSTVNIKIEEPAIKSERIHATNFQDTLTYIQAQPQTQPLIVALGTSWIKGYEKGRYLQYDALNPLIGSLRTYCESKGIPFVVDDDDKLLARINAERAKEGKAGAKVVVLAGKDTVASDEFTTLRNDEKNAFVVGVDNQELTTDSYIRLMEMLTLALKLSAGLEVSLDNTHITITMDRERHLYIFLPHAEPMDYERLKVIYEVQKFA